MKWALALTYLAENFPKQAAERSGLKLIFVVLFYGLKAVAFAWDTFLFDRFS